MNAIAMLAVVATLVTNTASISASIVSPAESRRVRTREMLTALKVDEAKREAFRYEHRKRTLNRAAATFQGISTPSNKVVSVTVDYRSGDICVEYEDGYKIIQRYTPPEASKPPKKQRKEKK